MKIFKFQNFLMSLSVLGLSSAVLAGGKPSSCGRDIGAAEVLAGQLKKAGEVYAKTHGAPNENLKAFENILAGRDWLKQMAENEEKRQKDLSREFAPGEEAALLDQIEGSVNGVTFLVVDDDPFNVMVLKNRLRGVQKKEPGSDLSGEKPKSKILIDPKHVLGFEYPELALISLKKFSDPEQYALEIENFKEVLRERARESVLKEVATGRVKPGQQNEATEKALIAIENKINTEFPKMLDPVTREVIENRRLIALSDFNMPGKNGMEFTIDFMQERPGSKVIGVSAEFQNNAIVVDVGTDVVTGNDVRKPSLRYVGVAGSVDGMIKSAPQPALLRILANVTNPEGRDAVDVKAELMHGYVPNVRQELSILDLDVEEQETPRRHGLRMPTMSDDVRALVKSKTLNSPTSKTSVYDKSPSKISSMPLFIGNATHTFTGSNGTGSTSAGVGATPQNGLSQGLGIAHFYKALQIGGSNRTTTAPLLQMPRLLSNPNQTRMDESLGFRKLNTLGDLSPIDSDRSNND